MKTFTEDKNHANTEPTQRLHSPHTIHNPALQCRGDGPQGPMPPQSKAICTPGKAYRAGSWRWARLLHGSISLPSCAQSPRAVPPFPQSLPIRSPSPHSYISLIHLPHTSHACACDQVRIKHDGRRFLCLAPRARYNLPLVLPPSTPYHKPPHAAHDPLLSCDGSRPSHGRATLLLSGRLEAYDKFRWRAGGCRGSLAAVLCVIGPQGRQIAPPLAHALPQSSHDLANLFLVAHFLSLPFAGASFAGASRRALFCPSFEGEEWERDLLSII